MSNGIPLPEFAKMFDEARHAFEASDLRTVLQINERFGQEGYSLTVEAGRLRLQNLTPPMVDVDANMTRPDYGHR